MARPYAWRPLACLPILKGRSFTNTDVEWQRRRRLSVYHSAMEHIVDDVNEICSTDRHYRFADKVVRCGRGFWHFLSIDANDKTPALWRRLVSRTASVFDQPAPNPLYRVNVDRCVKASHPLAQQ